METGKFNLLSNILSEKAKIIIPDLQRDYCWGKVKKLAKKFTENLIKASSDETKEFSLGLLYAYQYPNNYYYLCDGQQRITTLYLILGILNTYEKDEKIEKILDCGFGEPRLRYEVRNSTVYFLKELLSNVFKKGNKSVLNNLSQVNWWRHEYQNDPSIESMVIAIHDIDKLLKVNENERMRFKQFIFENVGFVFFDLKIGEANISNSIIREFGEKMYEIVNTRGVPMEPNEHLKPILLSGLTDEQKKEWTEKWETWQDFFWIHKNSKEESADYAFNDFLLWYLKATLRIDDIEEKELEKKFKGKDSLNTLNELNVYINKLTILLNFSTFEKYKKLYNCFDINSDVSLNTFRTLGNSGESNHEQQMLLIPLLSFMVNISDNEQDVYVFFRRLRKNYFDKYWDERVNNHVDWRYILQIIINSTSVYEVIHYQTLNNSNITLIQNINLNEWYNDKDKFIDELKALKIEEIEEWEDHKDFMGDLGFLLSINNSNSLPSVEFINQLKRYYTNYCNTINLIYSEEDAKKNPILANYFRLFRIFIDCNTIGHIYRANWGFEGVLFSTLNRVHLQKIEFKELCKCNNTNELINFCKNFIKTKTTDLFNINENNFQVDRFIKCWLTLKVFYAEMNGVLISFYDGNRTGVAAYLNCDENKLIPHLPFSLANSICGFAVRSGFGAGNYVHYTRHDLWCKPNVLDTPFGSVSFEQNSRTEDELNKNQNIITSIIDYTKSN